MNKGTTAQPINNLNWISDLMLKRARPIGHLAFWVGVLSFYTLYFGSRQDGFNQSLIFVGLLLPITIATTYFLLYWLIPKYLLQQKYFPFCLYFLYTLISILYLELLLVLVLYINVTDYQAMFVKPWLLDLLDVVVGMYLVIFLAVAINLLKRWLAIQSKNAELEMAHIESDLKLKDTELQLLKSQLHPHFLFNTLNNLYALALERSALVPDVVLKISEQLDYMLYQGDKKLVTIKKEWNHIQNYLALEALRYEENQIVINLDVTGDLEKHVMAPLLLIPFVENSFKHGVSQTQSPGSVDINLEIRGQTLRFKICNNKSPAGANNQSGDSKGIGLANVRRRLVLLYPDAHTLDIQDSDSKYTVHLTLELNTNA